MRDYAGKSDRDLLVEMYVTQEEIRGILEDHSGRIDTVEDEVKTVKENQLKVLGIGAVGGSLAAAFAFISGLLHT